MASGWSPAGSKRDSTLNGLVTMEPPYCMKTTGYYAPIPGFGHCRSAGTPDDLADAVTQALAEGFVPAGGPAVQDEEYLQVMYHPGGQVRPGRGSGRFSRRQNSQKALEFMQIGKPGTPCGALRAKRQICEICG
jgi:hypothetical protein